MMALNVASVTSLNVSTLNSNILIKYLCFGLREIGDS